MSSKAFTRLVLVSFACSLALHLLYPTLLISIIKTPGFFVAHFHEREFENLSSFTRAARGLIEPGGHACKSDQKKRES